MEDKNVKLVGFKLWQVIALICIAAIGCSTITYIMVKEKFYNDEENIYNILNSTYSDINNVYNSILEMYYKDIDPDELIDMAIFGMIEGLGDEYAEYFPPVEKELFDDTIEGRITGIGVSITSNITGSFVITNIFDESPAKTAGLQVGDIFTKVENDSLEGLYSYEVANLIKGEEGTYVNVTVLRNNEELTFNVERKEIVAPSITSQMFEENDVKVGYIDIDRFSSTTGDEFYQELIKLEEENISKLIIDVRSNTGGYLTSVTEIASYFISSGEVMYQLQLKDSIEKIVSTNENAKDYEIVILQNSLSASASEILSVALKEQANAQVIGSTSYGKGTAQKTTLLSNGGMVKFTVQNWLSPLGNVIDKVGVEATLEVELDEDYLNMPILINDNQLETAIDILVN